MEKIIKLSAAQIRELEDANDKGKQAAAEWRRRQNPDIARRINDREEDAYALGFEAGIVANSATVRDAFKSLHSAWLSAGHRSDMNEQMDELARMIGLDPLTLNPSETPNSSELEECVSELPKGEASDSEGRKYNR